MATLYFDVETTGKANFNLKPWDASNPRLVQLGALLADDNGKEIASMNVIIKPHGFEIPVEASNIHGITTEMANKHGIAKRVALEMFYSLSLRADLMVAFNNEFDIFVLDGEYVRTFGTAGTTGENGLDPFKDAAKQHCAMRACMNHTRLPGGRNGEFKWPKLQEAHKHFFGVEFGGSHDAMADVRATLRVHLETIRVNSELENEL